MGWASKRINIASFSPFMSCPVIHHVLVAGYYSSFRDCKGKCLCQNSFFAATHHRSGSLDSFSLASCSHLNLQQLIWEWFNLINTHAYFAHTFSSTKRYFVKDLLDEEKVWKGIQLYMYSRGRQFKKVVQLKTVFNRFWSKGNWSTKDFSCGLNLELHSGLEPQKCNQSVLLQILSK